MAMRCERRLEAEREGALSLLGEGHGGREVAACSECGENRGGGSEVNRVIARSRRMGCVVTERCCWRRCGDLEIVGLVRSSQ